MRLVNMNKKLFGLISAVVLMIALAVPAFAAPAGADDTTPAANAASRDGHEAASEAKEAAHDAANEAKDDLKESSKAEVEVENENESGR